MFGEVREGSKWGSNLKARNARNNRAAALQAEGYEVYTHETKSMGGDGQYFLFAFDNQEEFDIVKVVTPENEHPKGRRLNVRTIHVGMNVKVEHVQGETIDHRHGWLGTVVGVVLKADGQAMATVQFAGPASKRVPIEVFRLRQVAR